jgi:hypothetical protein
MPARISRELLLKIVAEVGGATKAEQAMNRLQDKLKHVAESQLKLAGAAHNSALGMQKMASNTDAVLKALDRFNPRVARTAYGLTSLVSKVGALNAGLGVMAASWAGRKVVGSARVGMAYNSNMEVAVERMAAEIRQDKESVQSAMRRSKQETAWSVKYARDARIYSSDTIQHALSDFAVLYRGDMAKARQATQLATILAAKNPHQGIEGAKIAIQEAESGQWTSPSRRFFLPKAMLEKYKDRGGLGALQATLQDMRIGPSLLRAMGNTAPGMEKQIGAMKNQLAGQATTGLYQARKEHLSFIRERMEGLTSEKGALTQISKMTGELGGKLGKMYYSVLEFPVRNADKILGFLKNLKRGLDPTIALLKSFGKGVYSGFIGPFKQVVGTLQWTGGVMGKMAGIASKLLGIGGKLATSPLLMLTPLANLLGKGAGTALAGRTVMKAMNYVGGPRGMYNLVKKAGPAGKKLWRDLGIPLFPEEGGLHYADGTTSDGIGGNGYVPDSASQQRILAAAKKSRRKGGGGRAPRHKGAQDFASILAELIDNTSAGNILGGMAGGSLADIIESQFIKKLSFFDDLAKSGENLSNVVQGVFQGMQGLLSPVNALGAAVGMLVTPFVVLGKVLKFVTAPFNSKAGHAVGRVAGMAASPFLMPAMFALGTAGTVQMFKQLGGMVTEGPSAFKKGWTKRIFNSFIKGTDFQQDGAGQMGQHYVGMAGQYLRAGLGMAQGIIRPPVMGANGQMTQGNRFLGGRIGQFAHGLLGRYSGLIGAGIDGRQSPVGVGLGALAETGDAVMDRLPAGHKRAFIKKGLDGLTSVLKSEQFKINQMKQARMQSAQMGAGINNLRQQDRQIEMAQRGVDRGMGLLVSPRGAPTSIAGLRSLGNDVKRGLGMKPIEETLQDTIERMMVKSPTWITDLPIWHREAPSWVISLANIMRGGPAGGGGGGTGGTGGGGGNPNLRMGGPSASRRRRLERDRLGLGRRNGGGGGGAGGLGGASLGAAGLNAAGLPLPNGGYSPLPIPFDFDFPPAAGSPPSGGGPSGGGLIGKLGNIWGQVSGWAGTLGFGNVASATKSTKILRLMVKAKNLGGAVSGLPMAGLGLLGAAVTSSGLGSKFSVGNLATMGEHLTTGIMGHAKGIIGQGKGVGTSALNVLTGVGSALGSGGAGHLKTALGMVGKAPMALWGGLNGVSRIMSSIFPVMWPMMLGGTAITGITAIAKKVMDKIGGAGGGIRGVFGLAKGGFQVAENALGNIGAKTGRAVGSFVGAGAGVALAMKFIPGKLKLPAALLMGLLGYNVGGSAGQTAGGSAGKALPLTLAAAGVAAALKFGGGKMMAGRGLNTVGGFIGRTMFHTGNIMTLPEKMAAKAFGYVDSKLLGGGYATAKAGVMTAVRAAGQAGKGLPAQTTAFLEEMATRPGVNPAVQKAAQRALAATAHPALKAAMRAAEMVRGGGGLDALSSKLAAYSSTALQNGTASQTLLQRGAGYAYQGLGLARGKAAQLGQYLSPMLNPWKGTLDKQLVTNRGLLFGGRTLGKMGGLVGGAGKWLLGTKLGRVAGLTALLAGGHEAAASAFDSHKGFGENLKSMGAAVKDKAEQAEGFLDIPGTLKRIGIGGAVGGGILMKTGLLPKLMGMKGISGVAMRLLAGHFGIRNNGMGAITRMGMRGLLRGGGGLIAKRGLMALPVAGQMIGAGMGGWDVGRFGMTHIKTNGQTLDQHMQNGWYNQLGGTEMDANLVAQEAKYKRIMHVARMKREGQINAAQAKAMVDQINKSGQDGAALVAAASAKTAKDITTAATASFIPGSGMTPYMQGSGVSIGAGNGAYTPTMGPFLPGGGKGWGHTAAASGIGGAEINKQVGLTANALAEKIAAQKRLGGSDIWNDGNGAVRLYNGFQGGNNVQNPGYTKQIRGYYDSKPWVTDMKGATGARLAEMQKINASADSMAKLKGLDPNLIKALMWHESKGWQPGLRSSDGKGGGLGQTSGYFPPAVMAAALKTALPGGKVGTPSMGGNGGPGNGQSTVSMGGVTFQITASTDPETAWKDFQTQVTTDPKIKAAFTSHILATVASPQGQRAVAARPGRPH